MLRQRTPQRHNKRLQLDRKVSQHVRGLFIFPREFRTGDDRRRSTAVQERVGGEVHACIALRNAELTALTLLCKSMRAQVASTLCCA